MSVYGYEKDTTPNLMRHAEEFLIFENAFSSTAWTSPGVVSIFTGYYPPVHAQTGRYSYYDKEMASPLRELAAQGYDVLGSAITGPTHEDLGFTEQLERREGGLEAFLEERTTEEGPFFAWSHWRKLHLPYSPSEEYAQRFGAGSRSSQGIEAVRSANIVLRPKDAKRPNIRALKDVVFTEDDVPIIRALYDGELAQVDERLGRVLDILRNSGLLDRTIVVITADHGEELFEHGWVGHASTSFDGKLYDELIRIPLLIRLPDQSRAGRLDALVEGVDIMPTIFDLLGVDAARIKPAMQGHSLMPVVGGQRDEIREFVFTQTTLKGWSTPRDELRERVVSVRSSSHKLIRFPQSVGGRTEGYDLREDPAELNDIYPSGRAEFEALERVLEDWTMENRSVAAELLLDGAERRVSRIERAALEEADTMAAVRGWLAMTTMRKTWGQEVDPVLTHEPYASRFQALSNVAALMVAKTMECEAKGGTLSADPQSARHDPESWSCRR